MGVKQVQINKGNHIDIKIKYFPFGGRGTALRLSAFIAGLTFEDEFISFQEFRRNRHERYIKWCTLPQITIYDEYHDTIATIGQSNACLRYIGFNHNLYPRDAINAANCDELMDCVEDIMLLLSPSECCGDEDKKMKQRQELSLRELPIWFQKLEWRLQENIDKGYHNGYMIGDTLTIADIKLFCFIRHFGHNEWRESYYKYIDEYILDSFPLLTKYKHFISDLESVKQFNSLWRKRHKGYKKKDSKYPACFVWNKKRRNNDKLHEDDKNNIEHTKFMVLMLILLLSLLITNDSLIPLIIILFWGITDANNPKSV